MKRILFAVSVVLLAAAATMIGAKSNVVNHVDTKKGTQKEIISSAGNCRHHLTAHPEDTVMTVNGPSRDPEDCN